MVRFLVVFGSARAECPLCGRSLQFYSHATCCNLPSSVLGSLLPGPLVFHILCLKYQKPDCLWTSCLGTALASARTEWEPGKTEEAQYPEIKTRKGRSCAGVFDSMSRSLWNTWRRATTPTASADTKFSGWGAPPRPVTYADNRFCCAWGGNVIYSVAQKSISLCRVRVIKNGREGWSTQVFTDENPLFLQRSTVGSSGRSVLALRVKKK